MIELATQPLFFFLLAGLVALFSAGILFTACPLKAVVRMSSTLVAAGAMFVILDAPVLGVVQILFYASVLGVSYFRFLKLIGKPRSQEEFLNHGNFKNFIKLGAVGLILGILGGLSSLEYYQKPYSTDSSKQMGILKDFSLRLFEEGSIHLIILGWLFLVVIVTMFTLDREENNAGS